MNWAVIGILCLVVAMVVGPIMMMQPSRWQRNLAALRTRAAEMGMHVKMEKIRTETSAVYGKAWPIGDKSKRPVIPWRLEKMPYTHGLHIAGYWHTASEQGVPPELVKVLSQMLDQLPAGIIAVEATAREARCYWNEQGGESTLQALNQWLDQFIVAAAPFIRRPLSA